MVASRRCRSRNLAAMHLSITKNPFTVNEHLFIFSPSFNFHSYRLPKQSKVPVENQRKMDDDAEVFKNVEKNPLAEFKKPVVIGKRPGTKSSQPLKSVNPKPDLVVQTNKQNEEQVTESLNKNPKQQLQTTPQQAPIFSAPKNSVLNYTPPPSSHKCSIPYQLEVLKDGVIIEVKELQEISKSYIVFGRLPTCDIPLHHPSISR